jgi:hypothetical protein
MHPLALEGFAVPQVELVKNTCRRASSPALHENMALERGRYKGFVTN